MKVFMKARLKFGFIIVLLAISFSACINFAISINENDYRSLSGEQRNRLQSYVKGVERRQVNNDSNFNFYEIIADDILSLKANYPFTWVHFWNPSCAGSDCSNISFYNDVQAHNSKVKVLLLTREYCFNAVEARLDKQVYNYPLFVLKSDYYGEKLNEVGEGFVSELCPDIKARKNRFISDFIWYNDSLVYYGNLDLTQLDSLLQVHNI